MAAKAGTPLLSSPALHFAQSIRVKGIDADVKLMLPRLLLGVLLLLPSRPGSALDPAVSPSQYILAAWDSEKGLPQNSVSAVAQTPDGYLWFGTQEGLVRFDGVEFRDFEALTGTPLKNKVITALLATRSGDLWIATAGGGVALLSRGSVQLFSASSGLSSDRVWSLLESRDGTIWIGTSGGLDRFTGGQLQAAYLVRDGHFGARVAALHQDSSGSLWIGTTGGGVFRLRDSAPTVVGAPAAAGALSPFRPSPQLPDERITSFAEDRTGALWLATFAGIRRIRGDVIEEVPENGGPGASTVYALRADSDGNVWAGTKGAGLFRFDGKSWASVPSLLDATVRTLFEDEERNLWVGSSQTGAIRLTRGRITPFGRPEGLPSDFVCAVHQDATGQVWAGTEAGGLSRLDGTRFRSVALPGATAPQSTCALGSDDRGHLWIGTSGSGLVRLSASGAAETYPLPLKPGDTVLSLLIDGKGAVWVGTRFSGLFKLASGKVSALGFEGHAIHDLLEGGEEMLAATNGGGVLWIGAGSSRRLTTKEGLGSDVVFCLARTGNDEIWAGTAGGGLNRISRQGVRVLRSKDGFCQDTVFEVLSDSERSLWMSTNQGLFRIRRPELDRLLRRRPPLRGCEAFGTSDGMRSREGIGGFHSATLRTKDGRLWFATLRGLAMIDPARLRSSQARPRVHLENVFSEGKPVPLSAGLVSLPLGARRSLEFHYSAASYSSPERVRFRYRLEGFDDGWQDAGSRRTAYYTNLPPGRYRFHVAAANPDGIWNEAGASIEFRLPPHTYETVWFYALLTGLVGAFAFWLHRLRVRDLRARFAVVAERNRLASEIHDGLAQGFTGVVLQLQAAERVLEEAAIPQSLLDRIRGHLEKARRLARQSLEEARASVWDLRSRSSEEEGLSERLRTITAELSSGTAVKVEIDLPRVPPRLGSHTEEELFKVLREAVANALLHGGAGHLRLAMKEEERSTLFEIEDDGCGFDVASVSSGKKTFGLTSMRDRIERLGGSFELQSAPGSGTRIIVTLPRRRWRWRGR